MNETDLIAIPEVDWCLSQSDLPRIYTALQRSGDTAETAAIRSRLLDPKRLPLPFELLTCEYNELASVFSRIPTAQSDPQYEEAVWLAAFALFTIRTLYGDSGIGGVNQIVGAIEKVSYGVRAFYHNASGILQDAYDLQTHFDNLGSDISIADRLDGLVADLYTDIVYGNGRERDNPGAYDELVSANLLYKHALALGYPEVRAKRLRKIVLGTRFDEITKIQPGRVSDDLVVRAAAAVDLHKLARLGESVASSQDIVLENMMSRRSHSSRVLGWAMRKEGVVPHTRQEALGFIQTHYALPVSGHPTATTLGGAYEHGMLNSAVFYEEYRAPDGWTLSALKVQRQNAVAIRQEATALAP